jgi:hypothetical protein
VQVLQVAGVRFQRRFAERLAAPIRPVMIALASSEIT